MPERKKDEQLHKDHRQRLKNRFLAEGLDGFTDIQVLELLLFYCIPRRDTNPIAHRLLNRFGSLSAVLDARVEELTEIDFITENAAVLLKILTQLSRRYQEDKGKAKKNLATINDCGEYLQTYFIGLQTEAVFLLCLDSACNVIACRKVGTGGINSASVSPREIVEVALWCKASTVILAHNHPSGLAIPSTEDIHVTRRLAAALDAVDVILADHIIVGDDDFVSLAQSGRYCYEDNRLEV